MEIACNLGTKWGATHIFLSKLICHGSHKSALATLPRCMNKKIRSLFDICYHLYISFGSWCGRYKNKHVSVKDQSLPSVDRCTHTANGFPPGSTTIINTNELPLA